MLDNISIMHIHAKLVAEALEQGEDAVRFQLDQLLKREVLLPHYSFVKDGENNETYHFNINPRLQSVLENVELEYIRTATVHTVTYWVGSIMMFNFVLYLDTHELKVS